MPFFLLPATVEAPAAIGCLTRLYAASAIETADGWALQIGNKIVPFDDHLAKSFDDKLSNPVVKDMFSIRYTPGEIRPVTVENEDPGRIRIESLFAATYPKNDLVQIDFAGQNIRVHRKVAEAFSRVAKRLEPGRRKYADFLRPLGGTISDRKIAGTNRTSTHAYGIAIDLNPARAHYWRWSAGRWQNKIPQSLVDAFEAEGFIWGGRWAHFDTMHFEYRPELLDAKCYDAARPQSP